VVAPAFHQSRQAAENGDALMRLHPAVAIPEYSIGSRQLGFEGGSIVRGHFGDWSPIISLYDL
jgi:hypothetical protein